jgi:hypothetical protein
VAIKRRLLVDETQDQTGVVRFGLTNNNFRVHIFENCVAIANMPLLCYEHVRHLIK